MARDILATYGVQPDHIPWAAGAHLSTVCTSLTGAGMDCNASDARDIRDAARIHLAHAVSLAAYAIRIDASDTTVQADAVSDEDDIQEWLAGGDLVDIANIETLDAAARKLAPEWLADDDWHPTWKRVATLPTLTCLRCGRIWRPQRDGRPGVCPRCKSYSWDKPRRAPASQS